MTAKVSRLRRLRTGALIGLAAAAVAASSAEAGNYIPGYTDFPNALRVADSLRVQHQSRYIAGYTDFPNALRVADARGTGSAIARSKATSVEASSTTFNWGDAGIGAGTTVGVGLLLLGSGLAVRGRARMVRTH
jgi:transcription elongation factor